MVPKIRPSPRFRVPETLVDTGISNQHFWDISGILSGAGFFPSTVCSKPLGMNQRLVV